MGKTIARKNDEIVSDDYLGLIRRFPLRPIRNEAHHERGIAVLQELFRRADAPGLSDGERDYCDVLNQLIGSYEDKHYPLPATTPLELLTFLMEEHDMNTTALGELLGSGRGHASLILNGKRELSKANIRVLADRFKINPGAFFSSSKP